MADVLPKEELDVLLFREFAQDNLTKCFQKVTYAIDHDAIEQWKSYIIAEGDPVKQNQPLLVVEAMKMQLEIKAGHAGTVKKILVREGDQVEAGGPLVELEEAK